ncbi:MAG: lysylphosphatidylglycerol synthase transmembrane domain-containing protein [Spirosomataceae bacterium]
MNFKKISQYLVSVGIAAGLLYWVFKDISLADLLAKFQQADYRWVLLAAILQLAAHVSRAYRWKMMLQPIGYQTSTYRTTLAVLVGYLVNLVLPRAGELARCGSLSKMEGVPFEKSFGAVVAERLVDVLVLLLLIGLNLALEFGRISQFFFEIIGDKFKNPMALLGLGTVFLLVVLLGYFLFQKKKQTILAMPILQKVIGFLGGVWEGFNGIRRLKNPSVFIFHTLAIWVLYYFTTYFLCQALPETSALSFLAVLTILVMGTIGMAAPTVGGIGSYHFFVGKIVVLYGLSQADGIALATFLHTIIGLVLVVLFGLAGFLLASFAPARDSSSRL